MAHTHTGAEWLAFLSLGFGVHGGFSVFYFLLVDADAKDFDPRPALVRASDRLLVEVVNAKATARDAAQHAALTAAALLRLLSPAPTPKGLR